MGDFDQYVHAALSVDRAPPCGNSPGDDDRGRLHVKVANKASEAVPVFITDIEPGTPFFVDASGLVTTPGTEQELFSTTVPAATTRNVKRIDVLCRQHVAWKFTADGDTVASGRTGPGHPRDTVEWIGRPFAADVELKLLATALANEPVSDIEGYLQASDT